MVGKYMKKALRKDFLMEIRKSFTRFISIFFIVALGVAFYAGIQASAPDMRYSADAYYDRYRLMDLKVVSTMGLTDADVEAIEALEGVSLAEPAYFTDVLCSEEEVQTVLHVESLTDSLNTLEVSEGRLPKKKGECIIDEDYMKEHNYQIGDTLVWKEDGDGMLRTKKFEIVGAASSPMYISFDRGNSTLGSGEVDAFAYVTEDSFESDVYTEIYMEAEGAREMESYSDAYDHLVAQIEERLEGIQDVQCQLRYEEVMKEANDKIADAEKELADGKQEAQEELDDAKKKLEEAQKELEDGQQEYEDGKQQLADARQEVEDGKQQLSDGKAEYEDGLAQLNSAREELNAQQAKLDASQQELNDGQTQLNDGILQLNAKQSELDSSVRQLEEAQQEIDSGRAQLDEKQEELNQQSAALQQQINEALNGVTDENMIAAIEAQFAPYQQQIDAGQLEIEKNKQKLDDSQEEINANQAKLNEGQEEINRARQELDQKQQELNDAQAQIDNGQAQINRGWSEILSSQMTLNDAAREIAENEKKIEDAEDEIRENEEKLKTAAKDLKKGRKELKDGWKEYEDGKADAEEEIADGERKLADARQELEDLKDPEWMISTRDDLSEYTGYGDNAQRIHNIGKVFPVLFFLVAALISLTTMTRMVEEQRTQIGTMKALGYSKSSIAGKYILYAAFATVGGSILGILVGEKLIPYIIVVAYKILYIHMPDVVIPYETKYALLASGAALFCTMAATMASCFRELLDTPAALMRPPAPKAGKRVLLERIPFLWKPLSFTWKSTIRNLVRYKKRFLMTVFGIGGCMALLIVGFGIRDSIMDIGNLQYGSIQRYDGLVLADEDASGSEKKQLKESMEQLEGVQAYTPVYFHKMEVKSGEKKQDAYLYVPEDTEAFRDFVTLRDRITQETFVMEDDGVIITEKIASLLEVQAGDEIVLKEGDERGRKVTIAAVCENYMHHYIYMTPKLYQECFGVQPEYQDILFTITDEYKAQEQEVGEEILQNEAALSISYTSAIRAQLDDMLKTLDMVILVLIVSAGLLAFVVLYNLNNISITERRRELATLKVLGFYDTEVSAYVFRENVLLTIFGVILGLGLGTVLHRFIIVTVETDILMFGRVITIFSYCISAVFTAGFSAFVNGLMHFKLKKIDMVESLKSVE